MAYLDHIIILLPHTQILHPPPWLTESFTISPGGTHSDGKTENRLICFRDGSYLELIGFIGDDLEKRRGHWWDKPYGIVDFALTTTGAETAQMNFAAIQDRLKNLQGINLSYEEPREGGRLRPDGKETRWHVTFPVTESGDGKEKTGFQRGEVPFFCHDITDRKLRVPDDEQAVTHACGVQGVGELSIFVPEERVAGLRGVFEAILGGGNVLEGVGEVEDGVNEGRFKIGRVNPIPGQEDVILRIRTPGEKWQVDGMRERGGVLLGDLVLGGRKGVGNKEGMLRLDVLGKEDREKIGGGEEFGVGGVMVREG